MIVNFQYNSLNILPLEKNDQSPVGTNHTNNDWSPLFEQLTKSSKDITAHCNDSRQLLQYIHNNFIFVKAAGGIVEKNDGQRLLMVRNERYDLPKGKVEPGETLAQAALRETSEETGLSHLSLGKLLLKTYHIYNLYGGWHFKQTSWFAIKANNTDGLLPQTEEGITQLQWLPVEKWNACLRKSYSTMRIVCSQIADTALFK